LLIKRLAVRSWRNLAREQLVLGERVTVLFGQNGQGKSNVLEAAYYGIAFRSFRASSIAEVIRWGDSKASIEAAVWLRGLDRTIVVEVEIGKKRTTLDGKSVRRDSDSLEGAGVVIFGPEDLRLPKAPAAERRRALDRAVFAVYRPYYREALDFERALKARNGVLRKGEWSNALLESYDETLAKTGARIVVRRRALARALAPEVERIFAEIHGGLAATIRYRSDDRIEQAQEAGDVEVALREGLAVERVKDVRRGFTGFGPQTDDLEMDLGGHRAREHGSQGQMRSLVLAFKMAELAYVEAQNQEAPVLLLDDVASELDQERRTRLFETLAAMACQTLITVTEREYLPELPGRVDWQVTGGHLERA
jgi:DNA replication and repair protein RecF